jgi:hypothetical protein
MSLRTVRQVAAVYWRKRFVRILAAALVLAAAIFFQYRLTEFFPLPVEVERSTPPYSPARAALREELIVDHPSWQPAAGQSADSQTMLFAGNAKDSVSVDAHFGAARLHDDMIELLRSDPDQKQLPPEGLQPISYVSVDEETAPHENEEPCRTLVSVIPADAARLPTELHFLQLKLGSDRNLTLEMEAVEADLVVQVETRNSTPNSAGKIQGPGCTKALSVGDWDYPPFSTALMISIVVPAGTRFGFSFVFPEETSWSAENGYEPFELEAAPLSARTVRKFAQGATSGVPLFEAGSVTGAEPLLLKHLFIRSDEVKLNFSGKAIVRENGKYVATFDPWEFAKKNQLLLAILTILNAALLEWLRRVAFGSKKEDGKPGKRKSRHRKKQSQSATRESSKRV